MALETVWIFAGKRGIPLSALVFDLLVRFGTQVHFPHAAKRGGLRPSVRRGVDQSGGIKASNRGGVRNTRCAGEMSLTEGKGGGAERKHIGRQRLALQCTSTFGGRESDIGSLHSAARGTRHLFLEDFSLAGKSVEEGREGVSIEMKKW